MPARCARRPPTNQSEIPSPDYDVVVFENRFPSFAGAGGDRGRRRRCSTPGRATAGARWCASPPTTTRLLSALPPTRMRTVIEAWADRTAALSAQPGVEQVFCFENRGVEIGVTLAHPHGQIYGYPFATPKTAAAIRSAQAVPGSAPAATCSATCWPARSPTAPASSPQNEHWVAFVPFAARWPVEVHLYPRRQVRDLTELDDAERDALAELYLEVIRRMEGMFDDTLPAITGVHQAPGARRRPRTSGCIWRCSPSAGPSGKIKYLAGSESAMGAFVNDITPEIAAQRLRAVTLVPR